MAAVVWAMGISGTQTSGHISTGHSASSGRRGIKRCPMGLWNVPKENEVGGRVDEGVWVGQGQSSDFPFLLPLVVNKTLEQYLSTCGKPLWQTSICKKIFTL